MKLIGLLILCVMLVVSWLIEVSFFDCSNWLCVFLSFWIRVCCFFFFCCKVWLICLFLWNVVFSVCVCLWIWFLRVIVFWNMLKVDFLVFMLCLVWFIKVVFILLRWVILFCRVVLLEGIRVFFGLVIDFFQWCVDCNVGKCLVDVDFVVLFVIGVEVDCFVVIEQFFCFFGELFLGNFQIVQDVVVVDVELQWVDFFLDVFECLFQIGENIFVVCYVQDQFFFDGVIEGQVVIWVGFLD